MKAVVSEITLQELEAVAVKLTKTHVHDHLLQSNGDLINLNIRY